jgi:uncharacterized protein with PIN domain
MLLDAVRDRPPAALLTAMSLHHRFVVDTMLGRLARWLRAMGYDTLYPGQIEDRALLRIAITEGRTLMTRDRMLARLAGQHGCLIQSERLDAQILEAVEQLSLVIDDTRWLSRCLDCNAALDPISKGRVAGRVPEHVLTTQTEFWHCPGCGKTYWPGSHSDRMLSRLGRLLRRGGTGAG